MKPLEPCVRKIVLIFLSIILHEGPVFSQVCSSVSSGTNLVKNGDFSQGYADWTYTSDPTRTNGYLKFDPPLTQNYSSPGFIHVGSNPAVFNSAFNATLTDHSPSADNNMLMVDGICVPGIKLWQQSGIIVEPNTNYYFSVWINALKNNNDPPGTLRFTVGTMDLPTTISAPTTSGTWVQYEAIWSSGSSSGPTTISIENTTVTGCDSYVDFAIDDITFIPGCAYGAPGPQPNLGADRTICGTGGSITLNAGIPQNSTTSVTWSDGLTGMGMSAPYSRVITTPGTYTVCVKDGPSCAKADQIVILNTFTVDIPNLSLCDPASVTLDAGHAGIGVEYKWYKGYPTRAGGNDSSKTFFVNTPGTYRVDVIDPTCGTVSDVSVITTTAPVPQNITFCPVTNATVSVTPANSGKYKWWNSPTGTAPANLLQKGGNTYTFPATATSDYTFYVEDTSSFKATIGPSLASTGSFTNLGQRGVQNETKFVFDAITPFVIDSVWMYVIVYSCPATLAFNIVNSAGTVLPGGAITYSYSAGAGCTAGGTWQWVRVPANVSVPVGTNYRIEYASSGTGLGWFDGGMTWGTTYASSVRFVGPMSGMPASSVPGMWRWAISAGTPCARVPVKAIYECSLPVEFLNVAAKGIKNGIEVNWSTAWENNSNNFVVERSVDGISFQKIGTVQASGNTSLVTNYSFVDKNPVSSVAYYRVVEVDYDGSQTTSKMVAVNFENLFFSVYPNPAKDVLNIQSKVDDSQELVISIQNSFGNTVYQNSRADLKSDDGLAVDISGFPSGLYFVMIESGNIQKIYKVIVE
ncbi:MAG: T9SS type A sorting domain-containing protein [Sporocytophaga sp.]|nr:T9SS type A sorting domain-containing protein [Sporocytophaga sp.]